MVYLAFRDNPFSSDREISELTGIRVNAINGRRNELEQMGLIVESGKRKCLISGRMVLTWDVVDHTTREKILGLGKREKIIDNFVYRDIVSRTLIETTAKIVQYFNDYPVKKYKTVLLYHTFDLDKGIYKAKLERIIVEKKK